MAVEEFLQGDLGTGPGSREGAEIDEVWSLGTMFSQLSKRSTRMRVSGILRQLKTFAVVPDVLCKFSKIGNVFSFK